MQTDSPSRDTWVGKGMPPFEYNTIAAQVSEIPEGAQESVNSSPIFVNL